MTFHIRRAKTVDLESLVSFAIAEAKEYDPYHPMGAFCVFTMSFKSKTKSI
jgi:hypothetical protein